MRKEKEMRIMAAFEVVNTLTMNQFMGVRDYLLLCGHVTLTEPYEDTSKHVFVDHPEFEDGSVSVYRDPDTVLKELEIEHKQLINDKLKAEIEQVKTFTRGIL